MSDLNDTNFNSSESPEINSAESVQKSSEPKTSLLSEIAEYAELICFSLLFVILALTMFFRICTVKGDSMINTLHSGEVLIVSDFFYTPERGDIVVIHQTGGRYNEPLVKRVIGLSGDRVVINHDTNEIMITDTQGNQILLEEEYLTLIDRPQYFGTTTYDVPEGKIFVLGDNRNNSLDSRALYDIGYVDSRRILGKAIIRLTPFSKFGAIE